MNHQILLFLFMLSAVSIYCSENTAIIYGDPFLSVDNKLIGPLENFTFVRQPTDREVVQGDAVRLYCQVSKLPHYNYHYVWYRYTNFPGVITMTSTDQIMTDANDEIYDIPSVSAADDGYYICKVSITGSNHTIISSSGKLTVNYFTYEQEVQRRDSAPVDKKMVQLFCDIPKSNPQVDVEWYKNDEKIIGNPRMFVLPEKNNNYDPKLARGSLIIMYIKKEDGGKYFCKTTYNGKVYLLTRYYLSIRGEVQAPEKINAVILSQIGGTSKLGGRAVFYCAGIGKPAPEISWTRKDGTRIESSDSIMLEDNRRRLVLSNVKADDDKLAYYCHMTVADMQQKSTILYMTILPSISEIYFKTTPQSRVIYPNKYPAFTLNCSIDYTAFINIDGNLKPVIYWLKDGKQLAVSTRMRRMTRENSVTKTLESSIEFKTPNEYDKGVYQCIAQSTEQIRQSTAYVNVRKQKDQYTSSVSLGQKYKAVDRAMTVDKAEEYCQSWDTNGHLVSIMNKEEAVEVLALANNASITRAWIGLTSEDNNNHHWKWTQPADNSLEFSFWAEGQPDDKYDRERYTVMDMEQEGRWRDEKNNKEYPFICKMYSATCPSVSKFYDNKVEPLNKAETELTTYGVGETITIICSDKTVPLKETITCTADQTFEPRGIACPSYDNSASNILSWKSLIIVTLLILFIS